MIVVLTANRYRQFLDEVQDHPDVVANRAELPNGIKGIEIEGIQYFWGRGFAEGEGRRAFTRAKEVVPFIRPIGGRSEYSVIDFA